MASTLSELGITPEKIVNYDQRIPRYTSYPTAPYWSDDVNSGKWTGHLASGTDPDKPLSLYIHIPFCRKRCYFCGCNVIITQKEGVSQSYLDLMSKEIELVSHTVKNGRTRPVVQLHLGGGTPNFLPEHEMDQLIEKLRSTFSFSEDAELSIEVDPRVATPEYISSLEKQGFNRISYGVQDFNPEVQTAIGREQTRDITFLNVKTARELGFKSVNIDLIYGLPSQSLDSWRKTIEEICVLRPDRIALYNFAYLPDKLRNQKLLNPDLLPPTAEKLNMFIETHDRLTREGYVFIGMDHYALKEDTLNRALQNGGLRRNFMGYTTLRGTDLLSFGVSSISDFNGGFGQNVKKLSTYKTMLQRNELPVERGLILSEEDRIRQYMIEELMCNGYLNFERGDEPSEFAPEAIRARVLEQKEELQPLEEDGLIVLDDLGLKVTEKGRIFLRNIAVHFDAYLKKGGKKPVFSRAV